MDEEIVASLAELRDRTDVLIALYDQQDRLRYANAAFRTTFALEPDETPFWPELMRRNRARGLGTIIRVDDFEAWLTSAQSRRGKVPFRAYETDLIDGRWLWMTETVNRGGWMLCIASDITHLRADERDLRQDRDLAMRASQTDELTGISNRRYVMGKLEEMIAGNAAERPREGCLCILDIDFFKGINDLYGHQTGDEVLLDFARKVQPIVRRHDCFGRVGGEEFMLLLPDTTIEEAEGIIRRIMDIVRASRPLTGAPLFRYTCSAGLAAMISGDSAKALYARADAALYSAKQSGRDQIIIAAA